ncbi:MAG TPA: hypothetical protein PLB01_20560 [Thermoanaerobaculia bacterium]|nr:hypothetical protein [Thermoanaerobaculia bacterium]
MRRKETEEDANSPYLFCEQCEQMYERLLIQECPYCEKRFCRACAVRSGQQQFCGKACAKNWFFSDEEEESEDAVERGELDKGDV